MLRLISLIALIFGCTTLGLGLALRAHDSDATTSYNSRALNYGMIASQARKLDARLQAHRDFVAFRSAIVGKLAVRKTTLIAACEQLREHAVCVYPKYLLDACSRLGNGGIKEWLARRLVSEIDIAIESERAAHVIRKLEKEMSQAPFRAWCRTPWRELTADPLDTPAP